MIPVTYALQMARMAGVEGRCPERLGYCVHEIANYPNTGTLADGRREEAISGMRHCVEWHT